MPWKVVKRGDDYCVVESETGETEEGGCHPTREEALKHARALYANVPEGRRD